MSSADASSFTSLRHDLPPDNYLWTASFFNERFPEVVSPLGWSIVGALVERSAFREPLAFVGYRLAADYPLTKLQDGHVYTNVGVFQRLYRLFPALLIPGDAARYFPCGDVALRLAVAPPPPATMIASMLRALAAEPAWHPWGYRTWERFVPGFETRVAAARRRIDLTADPWRLLAEVGELMQTSLALLRLHRWSLTYAGVTYDFLNRLLAEWVGAAEAGGLAAALVTGLQNHSTTIDGALARLADEAGRLSTEQQARLQASEFEAFLAALGESEAGRRFNRRLDQFLDEYGHRSASLDLRYPAYADDPTTVLAMVARLAERPDEPARRAADQRERRQAARQEVRCALSGSRARWRLLSLVLDLTQQYTVLRENQRFYWQKSMHAKRRALLKIAAWLTPRGTLREPDDIFYLKLAEVTGLVHGWLPTEPLRNLIVQRREEAETARSAGYPPFLLGSTPLETEQKPAASEEPAKGYTEERVLTGLAASPGHAQGRAVVVSGPAELQEVVQRLAGRASGDNSILVATATDPAWTPLFLRVAGLVLERGGQLSHGAVVAREYGLPAVVGVKGALNTIAEGTFIMVDGGRGTVTLLT